MELTNLEIMDITTVGDLLRGNRHYAATANCDGRRATVYFYPQIPDDDSSTQQHLKEIARRELKAAFSNMLAASAS